LRKGERAKASAGMRVGMRKKSVCGGGRHRMVLESGQGRGRRPIRQI